MSFPRRDGPGAAPYALGAMNFGKRTPPQEAKRILDRALDAGIDLVDTANAYGDGASERFLGEALRGRARIATKVGFAKGDDLSPDRVRAACEASLGRLRVDSIDLYYLHVPDHRTPIEATLESVQKLIQDGKIRAWGVSNYASWQILEMRQLAERAGMPLPAVAQQLYNPLIRQLDIEYFRFVEKYPIHTTVYNPLAGGLLARAPAEPGAPAPRDGRFANPMYRRRYWRDGMHAATAALAAIAADEGLRLLELAYAFALHHPGVDSVLVGPGSLAHLEDALAARERRLSDEGEARVRAVYHELVGSDASYAR